MPVIEVPFARPLARSTWARLGRARALPLGIISILDSGHCRTIGLLPGMFKHPLLTLINYIRNGNLLKKQAFFASLKKLPWAQWLVLFMWPPFSYL
jgi:hypothetical protein